MIKVRQKKASALTRTLYYTMEKYGAFVSCMILASSRKMKDELIRTEDGGVAFYRVVRL